MSRLRNIPTAMETVKNHDLVIQYPAYYKNKWADIFANVHPIHIEIGMGKGQFILNLAKANPQINYIGIEKHSSVMLRALEKRDLAEIQQNANLEWESAETVAKAQEQQIKNLRFICIDAENLKELFGKDEVEKIYLNFSDPWPKARHEKRRLTSKEFLRRYEKIMVADGLLEFKTDNVPLFDFSLEALEGAGWTLVKATYDLHGDAEMSKGNIMTEYEEKFSAMGKPICKLIGKRK